MWVNKKEYIYILLMFLLLIAFFQYGINKIVGFSIFPDEFGYWASAANLIGWDWSQTASLGSYYSYGYSLILFPLLLFGRDSIMAYKLAIAVNMLLMGTAFFLLLKIKRSVYGKEQGVKDILLCMTALFYPPWIFYMQMTLTEALLMFVYVLSVFLLIKLQESNTCIFSILFAIILGYLYVVHMRTVGVLIAGCMVMIFMLVVRKEQRKKVICFVVTLVIAGIIAAWMKTETIQAVYSHADSSVVSINDYAGRLSIFKELLTLSGIVDLLISLLGKVFYLGCASLGLFYSAIYYLGKKTYQLLYKIFRKKETENQEWFSLFLLLSVIGELLIGALAMYRLDYVDGLIYGRYSEFVMPILLMIGIKQMLESRHLFIKWGITAITTGLCLPVLIFVVRQNGMERTRGYHVPGMSYMLTQEYGGAESYLIRAWLFFIALMLVVTLVVWLAKHKKHMEWIICCVVLIEFGLGMHIANHYAYPSNTANHMDRIITDTIKEQFAEGETILFVNDGKTPYVDFLQMQLREKSIEIINASDMSDCVWEADYLIMYSDMEETDIFNEYYENRVISNQYTLYFHTKEETTGL